MIASLHGHGEYSLLDGAGTAVQHVEAAKASGYAALALTDHGTLAGALHHMRACREGGIMPIVGVEAYYRPNRRVQGQKEWLRTYWHLTLHAKDIRGWHSLMGLVSEAHRSGFYGKACVDDEILERYREGIMCSTGCLGGKLAQCIVNERDREAEAWIRQLLRIYGDDLSIEIMPHSFEGQAIANIEAVRIAQRHGILVATTLDEHYPTEEWAPTQDVLLMIATNQTVKKRERKRTDGEDIFEFTAKTLFHMTEEQIRAEYARNHPQLSQQVINESLRNTLVAAGRTTPFLVDRSEKMPAVSVPKGITPEAHLKRLCYEGLKRRGYLGDPAYREGLDFELDTFARRGQTTYMLLVDDVVKWARSDRPVPRRVKGELVYEGKKKPIAVGPGRGSAAGSKAAWSLYITNLNPVKYRCLFERFVNPDRVGLPDIDLDFPPDRVDEVEAYLAVVHGKDRVVDIIAHSTFGPRAALTDAGRVLSISYEHVKAATKTIDDQDRSKLEDLRKVNSHVARLAEQYPDMWQHACRIQGQVARKSEHAGGVLILPGPVQNYIPVERQGGQKGKLLSAFGERAGKGNALISEYGYTKLDVLRVAELRKQQKAVDLIAQRTGEVIDLDALPIHDDPYAVDPKVMQAFKDGLLVGVFQFSATAAKLTRQLKPDNVLDLALINAGIRPGPRGAGADQRAVRRKNGIDPLEYWHPKLEPYMNYTYGEMFFQEQLIEVVHHLGGLTKANADIFRKIASKLYREPAYAREVMGQWYEPIRDGFIANGIETDTFGYPAEVDGDGNVTKQATGIWAQFLSFSDYSFNLAHAAGYSVLAYRDMWLKVYYPREFYAAFLSVGLSQITKKRALQKQEAAREMRNLPPYITTTPYNILPPDINISGSDYTVVDEGIRLGLQAIKHVGPATAAAIEEHRPFMNMQDLERRVPAQACNITARAALIMAGAFDAWDMRNHFTEDHIDELERELLGMSLTSVHSIQKYAGLIEGRFWTEDEVEASPDGTRVTIMGEVVGIKEHTDSKGGKMAFADIAYGPNQWNVTIFSYLWAEFEELITSRRPLMVTGVVDTYVNPEKGIERRNIVVQSLPPSPTGESFMPIMDLEDYIEMTAEAEEGLANDSVFPEDLAELREPEQSSAFAAALSR